MNKHHEENARGPDRSRIAAIRSHLKTLLIDLEAARAKRLAGQAARIPASAMRLLEAHLMQASAAFDALMQELIAQGQHPLQPCIPTARCGQPRP